MDLVIAEEVGIGMIKNELYHKLDVLSNVYNQKVSDKICDTEVIEDHRISMTHNELINDDGALPDIHTKSVLDIARSASTIINSDFGISKTKNELTNKYGVLAESR
eukprot:CAMPEP_0197640834 /NCGR_PEP_ID=MMETSP1338-20131121/14983_1 /TAXON_ID=43686 ORGANISM="Pelagodinium beii, Strain RCC1491" /NCGR_SAMPLE_ID=MMETSP1338 /ASSEMBLY_ACC=CAM_ASM_000754 /LENGTH=105 /DNA_ID=CAMNT_0043213711 /DNA_START=162 /DNA_END=479 /DNA_ORIENTATION=-